MNRFSYTKMKKITSYPKVPHRHELFGDYEGGAVNITDLCIFFEGGWTLNRGMPQTPKLHNHSFIKALALRNLLVRTIL